jgi:hypothetical protein
MHLSPDELIDLAEDARAEAAVPHLQSCEVCRHQVVALRATMSTAAGIDVPEPSPLFWDHLSHRVREGIDREEVPAARPAWRALAARGSWRGWTIAGVAAAVIVSIYVTTPRTLTRPWPRFLQSRSGAAAPSAPLKSLGAADDPSLTLFADLTEQIDPQAIAEIGWSSHASTVDEVVGTLTEDERLELRRLLKEELAKS